MKHKIISSKDGSNQVVEAMDFRSDGGSARRFESRHGHFFYDNGGATRKRADKREAQASTCRNERSECRR